MFAFLVGFVCGLAAVVGLFFFAGQQTRPLLRKRLDDLDRERKTVRAKAVKLAASVDKFKVTTVEAVYFRATPAHIVTAGIPCRMTMIGGAITISTAHALAKTNGHYNPPTNSPNNSPEAVAESPTQPIPSRAADRVVATISAKNVICTMDPSDRSVLHLSPRVSDCYVAEVTDKVDGMDLQVKWRALSLTFVGGAREAERWFTVLNPTPATERWVRFVRTVPSGADTSLNFLVARVLFENSAETTLDEFIASKVRKKLTHVTLPKPLMGSIDLLDLHFGDEAPFFTNSAFTGVNSTGEFGFDFDILYRGGFTMTLSVTIQVGPLKVPHVLVDVKIKQIKGKVHLSCGSPPSNKLWLGFHGQPELSLEIKQDIHLPQEARFIASAIRGLDLSEAVSDIVKVKLFEDMILPQMDDIPIPDVGPTPPTSPLAATAGEKPHGPVLTSWQEGSADAEGKLLAGMGKPQASGESATAPGGPKEGDVRPRHKNQEVVHVADGKESNEEFRQRVDSELTKHINSIDGEETCGARYVSKISGKNQSLDAANKGIADKPADKPAAKTVSDDSSEEGTGERKAEKVKRASSGLKARLAKLVHRKDKSSQDASRRGSRDVSPAATPAATPCAAGPNPPALPAGGAPPAVAGSAKPRKHSSPEDTTASDEWVLEDDALTGEPISREDSASHQRPDSAKTTPSKTKDEEKLEEKARELREKLSDAASPVVAKSVNSDMAKERRDTQPVDSRLPSAASSAEGANTMYMRPRSTNYQPQWS